MDKNKFIKDNFGISDKTLKLVSEAEESIKEQFKHIENICEINQLRVMKAFADNRVSDSHFVATTGYGYDDLGRDTLDRVYADIMGAEDALVRHNFISGTHTISTALFAVLRPNDILVSITGKPYDTLEEVIGIQGEAGNGSLKDFGVKYVQIDLKHDGTPDLEQIKFTLTHMNVKAVTIQRSKGYGWRPTYSAKDIGALIEFVKEISPETICIVDNCYGEFVQKQEPTDVGADLIAGSLIKNAGGGIARTGGYIAGRHDLVEKCAYRLTTPGLGKEVGATVGMNRELYMGLFFAPHTVGEALKSAVFISSMFESFGYDTTPHSHSKRGDIVQSLGLENEESLVAFCQGIQSGSPVDSYLLPEPWDMPGYDSKVVMAAGAFTLGSSIELSADAPIREPFYAWIQGGLNFHSAKICAMLAAQQMKDKGLLKNGI